jgi:hypothetical protein
MEWLKARGLGYLLGAEFFFKPRWSLLVKFDGEFAPGSQTYGG